MIEYAHCSTCGDDHAGRCPELAEDRRIGQIVDAKYHILRRLACGGMGTVYEARHVVVGRHFALKFLHEHYARRNSMVQRFLREAQAAGSIASEHIIGVLDYGTAEGTPYLVMELVRGQDLRELLASTPRLPPARAVRIILDACRGLSLAHDRGLVHRDLKPANICITQGSDGREIAKVIDFGVAKLRDGADLSDEGTLIGTVGYMAPEQLTDQRQLDSRADIYALGVILYQALAGRPPHLCDRSELLYRIVSVDPVTLAELCPDLPLGLSEVVQRALMRSKERRYASVRDFARALEPFAGEGPRASEWGSDAPLARSRAARAGRMGTAETELENAPTWVALAQTGNPHADRHCEPQSSDGAPVAEREIFCRQPAGAAASVAPAQRHQHISQRALAFSVGALALSVVAMTTMFIFVYSHGSRALEAGAHSAAKPAAAHATAPAGGSTAAPSERSAAAGARGASSGSEAGAPGEDEDCVEGEGRWCPASIRTELRSLEPAQPSVAASEPPTGFDCD